MFRKSKHSKKREIELLKADIEELLDINQHLQKEIITLRKSKSNSDIKIYEICKSQIQSLKKDLKTTQKSLSSKDLQIEKMK